MHFIYSWKEYAWYNRNKCVYFQVRADKEWKMLLRWSMGADYDKNVPCQPAIQHYPYLTSLDRIRRFHSRDFLLDSKALCIAIHTTSISCILASAHLSLIVNWAMHSGVSTKQQIVILFFYLKAKLFGMPNISPWYICGWQCTFHPFQYNIFIKWDCF